MAERARQIRTHEGVVRKHALCRGKICVYRLGERFECLLSVDEYSKVDESNLFFPPAASRLTNPATFLAI